MGFLSNIFYFVYVYRIIVKINYSYIGILCKFIMDSFTGRKPFPPFYVCNILDFFSLENCFFARKLTIKRRFEDAGRRRAYRLELKQRTGK